MSMRYRNICYSFAVAQAILHAMPAKGQVYADTAKSNQALEEIVVTGQYGSGTAANAVQKIRVIDRRQIEAMAAQNLRDVLSNEAGIRIGQDNILGSSISLQGISGQNIKYLLDGVPVIGRQDGDIDLTQINLSNIERIEIVRGPMSVNYGNNALGGTINLITRKTQQTSAEAGVAAYYESIGAYNLNARAAFQKQRHRLSLSGGRNFFDGWSNGDAMSLDRSAQPADARRYQQWKPREQRFGELQYSYTLPKVCFSWKGSMFDETITNRGLPRGPYGESALDDRYRTQRIDNALFVQSAAINGLQLSFQAAYNYYHRRKNTYVRDLTTLDEALSQNSGDQDTSAFRLLHSRASLASSGKDTRLAYELGYDINVEYAEGKRILNGKQQLGDYALFASSEYKPLRGLTLRPGFRYAYNTRYKAPVTPAVNVKYSPDAHWTFRASYANGFRAPDLKELFFYFVDVNHNIQGNSGLQAERSHNWNLNADYAGTKGRIRYRLEANGFYNDINNLITLAAITGTEYSYVNIGAYKTHGGNLNATVAWKQLTVSAGAVYTGILNRLSETTADIAKYSYSPETRASLQWDWRETGISAALFYKYTGRTPGYAVVDSSIVQTRIANYHTADLSLSKALWGKRVRFSAGVKNMFDVRNINILVQDAQGSNANMPLSTGRNYFLKLDFNFRTKS